MARIDTSGDCWRWTASHNSDGRPQVNFERKNHKVDRLVYQWQVGPIPDDQTLTHSCTNVWCCDPSHLAVATRAKVSTRGDTCKRGHPRAEWTRTRVNGWRYCLLCRRELEAARLAKP